MNTSAAQAEYIQGAAEGIGFTLVMPLGRVIFDHSWQGIPFDHLGIASAEALIIDVTTYTLISYELVRPGGKRSAQRLRMRRGSRIEAP